MENIGSWAASNAINQFIQLQLKYIIEPGGPEKTCLKKPRRENTVQEIWDGPGSTYVPLQNYNNHKLPKTTNNRKLITRKALSAK